MSRYLRAAGLFGVFALIVTPGWSGSHTWVINEVFSNADGTIQYVEMWTPSPNEYQIGGKRVSTDTDNNLSSAFPANLPQNSTQDKYLLLGTSGFASLPGAPALDMNPFQDNFFSINGDELQWHIYGASILNFGPGDLPTDGVQSLDKDGITTCGTPTNFAGDRLPPTDASGLLVGKVTGNGSRLSLSWNDCFGSGQHHIVHGVPSDLGGTYTLSGSKCDIGCSPYNWFSGVPAPASGEWVWFLVLSNDGATTEGSWGTGVDGNERNGAGPGGSSGVCSITAKNATNNCGP